MKKFCLEVKKFILSKIFGKFYYRTGKCKACGKCCEKIYVKHYNHVVKDEEEFKKLQFLHRFYTYLKVVDKDDTGLVFECQNLDKVTRKCKIHKSRPGICRRYPQEELFSMGGALSEDCGFQMKPIVPFEKVLKKAKQSLKIILPFVFVFWATSVDAYNGFSDKMTKKFKTCSIYSEESSVNLKGTVFNDMKFFFKGENGMCNFHEIVYTIYGQLSFACKFTPEAVEQLYNSMSSRSQTSFSNPTAELWDGYVNNPDVCTKSVKMYIPGNPLVPEEYLPWHFKK